MSHVRHVLQSVELPAITNARASGDYHPGNDQWKLGVSSLLAHAVGIAPSKDNYWCALCPINVVVHFCTVNKSLLSPPYMFLSFLSTYPISLHR